MSKHTMIAVLLFSIKGCGTNPPSPEQTKKSPSKDIHSLSERSVDDHNAIHMRKSTTKKEIAVNTKINHHCQNNNDCQKGRFCKYPEASCGKSMTKGVCFMMICRGRQTVAKVCGCDGNTYLNECKANEAGVSIASNGACARSLIEANH